MTRKILAGVLLFLSSTILLLSLIAVGGAWWYNEPLTEQVTARLTEITSQLQQAQTDLRNAKAEVERALRIIQSAEEALISLTDQAADAKQLLEQVNQTLDEDLIPDLDATRSKLNEARTILEDLRASLNTLNALPFIEFNAPGDELLAGIISGVDSLDAELGSVQDLAKRASTFINDTSYLLGGDFLETKQNLQDLLQTLATYDDQLTTWQQQVDLLSTAAPQWIDNASLSLTVALLWVAFSQVGLILHGINLLHGVDPWHALRKPQA